MSATVVERLVEDDATTRAQAVRLVGPWGVFRQYALPLTLAGLLTLAPSGSTNTANRTNNRDYVVYRADSATFRQPFPTLRARGWAFAQRMSDAAKLAVATKQDEDENDDLLVEPPDPSIWKHLPATSWS